LRKPANFLALRVREANYYVLSFSPRNSGLLAALRLGCDLLALDLDSLVVQEEIRSASCSPPTDSKTSYVPFGRH
jgi:hypothetical protein